MKRLTLKSTVLTVFVVLLALLARAQYGDYTNGNGLLYEHMYLPSKTYETGAKLFLKLFQCRMPGSGLLYQFQPQQTFEVTDYAHIRELKNIIIDSPTCYKALRIIPGLKEEPSGMFRPIFIYVPVRMKWHDSAYLMDNFIPIPESESTEERNNAYILNTNKEFKKMATQAERDSVNTWIENYRNHIWIDRNNMSHFEQHNKKDSDSGDMKSETFAFGEIEFFFNNGGEIFITSWANIALMHGQYTFKHFIAFSNSPYTNVIEGTTFAADLGTMCPPNCMITKIHAGRALQLMDAFTKTRVPGRTMTGAATSESSTDVSENKTNSRIIWILVIIGSVLTGFIASRLLKK